VIDPTLRQDVQPASTPAHRRASSGRPARPPSAPRGGRGTAGKKAIADRQDAIRRLARIAFGQIADTSPAISHALDESRIFRNNVEIAVAEAARSFAAARAEEIDALSDRAGMTLEKAVRALVFKTGWSSLAELLDVETA